MEKSEVISTLSELLKTSRDGECGFGDAAKQVKSGNLKATLETAASRCAVAAAELETHVRALGGETPHSGAVTGALHRAWSDHQVVCLDDG